MFTPEKFCPRKILQKIFFLSSELLPKKNWLSKIFTNEKEFCLPKFQPRRVPNIVLQKTRACGMRNLLFRYSDWVSFRAPKNDFADFRLFVFMHILGLFNLRATDVQNTPVFYSYALYSKEKGLHIFLHNGRENDVLREHFKTEGVEGIKILNYLDVAKELQQFVSLVKIKLILKHLKFFYDNDLGLINYRPHYRPNHSQFCHQRCNPWTTQAPHL